MKQADIDRLKEICEKEGFYFDWDHVDHSAIIVREKKNLWDGVEFVECIQNIAIDSGENGKIFKVIRFEHNIAWVQMEKATKIKYFKPSTESAYVDQLKKECFERYGEIKYGDKFQSDWCDIKPIQTIGHGSYEFSYWKNTDNLLFNGVSIYQSGKWAKKLPEMIEVNFFTSSGMSNESKNGKYIGGKYVFEFIMKNGEHKNLHYLGPYLSKCLEEKLNNEAGN